MKTTKINTVFLLLFFAGSVFNIVKAQHPKFKQVQRFHLNMPLNDTAWSEPQVFTLVSSNTKDKRTQQISVKCKYVKHRGTSTYFEVRTTNLGPSTLSAYIGIQTAKEQFTENGASIRTISGLGNGWWLSHELWCPTGLKGKKMSGIERATKSGPIDVGYYDVYFVN